MRQLIDEGLVANAAARGVELTAGLRALMAEDPRIGDVRGPGLMIGVELVRDQATREPDPALCDALIARAADEGLLVLSCGHDHNVVRFIAPLNVTADEIDEALTIFRRALRSLPVQPDTAGAGTGRPAAAGARGARRSSSARGPTRPPGCRRASRGASGCSSTTFASWGWNGPG